MAIYGQIAHLPIIFQLGNKLISNIDNIISNKNLLFQN
jgi:hypothetical protein